MENFMKSLVTYIMETYQADIIILYGSYARGEATDESDIDVICFSDSDQHQNDTSVFMDHQLDLWLYPKTELQNPEQFLHVHDGIILMDVNKEAEKLLSDLQTLYMEKPEATSDEQKEFLKAWMLKMYKRTSKGDVEGNYRHIWLLKDILEIYFELRDERYEGPKKALNILSEIDERTFRLYEQALTAKPGSKIVLELINRVIQ